MILTSKAKQFCSNFVSVLCYLKDRHNLEATAGSVEILHNTESLNPDSYSI